MLGSGRMMGLALVAALAVASAASAQEVASAEVAGSSATSRPFYVGLGIGGVFGVSGGAGSGSFRLEEDIGYHVWSLGNHPGLFVGLLANQAFRSNWLMADIDARVGFDINVYDWGAGRLLITPGIALGVTLLHWSTSDWAGNSITDTTALFNFMLNAELRAVLVDGLLTIWFRPIGVEILARDGTSVNWDLNAGVLFNF